MVSFWVWSWLLSGFGRETEGKDRGERGEEERERGCKINILINR